MTVLALNAGSSSIKLALFDLASRELWRASVSGIGSGATLLRTRDPESAPSGVDAGALQFREALDILLRALAGRWPGLQPVVVGHRVVHGGDLAADTATIDAPILARINRWAALAPLHQHLSLAAIEAARQAFPAARHVACFDTGFHRSLPPQARLVALPEHLRSLGLRRYGFHGLSFESVLQQLAADGEPVQSERVVVAHLGGGSSLCAVLHGRSVDTSMGVTPLGGVPMATRCGDLDPGAILFLLQDGGLDARRLQAILYEESGLRGLSGASGDMKQLLDMAVTSAKARVAVDYYCYQIRRQIGALAAAMEGIDRIVFTGGIGANAPVIRKAICTGLSYLGVELSASANASSARTVCSAASGIQVNVVQTDEEAVIARKALAHREGGEARASGALSTSNKKETP